MMRKVFQDQLEELHVALIQMGALCERAILSAEKTMLVKNEKLAGEVHHLEQEIDQKEISKICA